MSRKPSTAFGITQYDDPILDVPLKYELKTGIHVASKIPQLIPEYQVINAAQAAGYRYYHEWQDLSWEERSVLVAHYLAVIMVRSHTEDAQLKEINKKQKKRGKK